MEKNKIPKGKKISRRKVNADNYMPLHEFLMYDPIYRKMPEKAKLLYSYLRNKVSYFEKETEKHQNGVEGTKSYLDENGDIFLIADNTELMYLLNASEPTIIKMKKELDNHGLLTEEQSKHGANRIYILLPSILSDTWAHIDEINELREQNQKARKEKNRKLKEKKNAEREVKKAAQKQEKINDLKNLSHDNLKNLSHDNLKNLSEPISKGFKSNLKSNINLSIYDEVDKIDLPDSIKEILKNQMDRLISDSIKLKSIETNYKANASKINEHLYAEILTNVLDYENPIVNFSKFMNVSIKNELNPPESSVKQHQSKEIEPIWFKEKKHKQKPVPQENKPLTPEQEKIAERLRKYSAN